MVWEFNYKSPSLQREEMELKQKLSKSSSILSNTTAQTAVEMPAEPAEPAAPTTSAKRDDNYAVMGFMIDETLGHGAVQIVAGESAVLKADIEPESAETPDVVTEPGEECPVEECPAAQSPDVDNTCLESAVVENEDVDYTAADAAFVDTSAADYAFVDDEALEAVEENTADPEVCSIDECMVPFVAPVAVLPPPPPLSTLDLMKLQQFEQRLNASSRIVHKLSKTIAPWKAIKYRKAADVAAVELEEQKAGLITLLHDTLQHMESMRQELSSSREQLASHNELVAKSSNQEASIEKLRGKLAEYKEKQQQETSQLQNILAKVEECAPGPKKYLKDPTHEAQKLQKKIDQLLAEHAGLQTANAQLIKSKSDLTKKVKDLQDKVRNDAEVKEREMRKLANEMRKLGEAKEAELASTKEAAAEQLAAKVKEVKMLQRRFEPFKNEMEQLRMREKTLKSQLEEATASQGKAQDDAKSFKAKFNDARLQKEDMAREMEQLKTEMAMLARECAEGAKGSMRSSQQLDRWFNKDAAWPRHAFTMKGGLVLHNRPSCGTIDVSKLVPLEYQSHRELEEVQDRGTVLCHHCRANGGF